LLIDASLINASPIGFSVMDSSLKVPIFQCLLLIDRK
jgi:hypothetical protein